MTKTREEVDKSGVEVKEEEERGLKKETKKCLNFFSGHVNELNDVNLVP